MAVYAYEALTASGETAQGLAVAPDLASAVSGLRQKAVYVTEIFERPEGERLPGRIRDVAAFARHLALLLQAGMHLIPALETLRNSLTKRDEIILADYVIEALSQGESLASAFGRFPSSFPPEATAVLASGEETASIPQSLLTLAESVETRKTRFSAMVAAIAYPAFILLLSTAVVVLLLMFVFPKLAPLLPKGGDLPLPTRILLFAGGIAHTILPWVAIVLGIALVAVWRFRKGVLLSVGSLALKIPLLSRIVATAEIARFTQMLSGLLAGKIDIVKALSLSAESASTSTIRTELLNARDEVSEGKSLAKAFVRVPHMPGVVLAALSVGEQSRSLPKTLLLVSQEMYQQLDRAFRILVAVLTPALIIAAGIIVAWIVAAVILPVTAQAVQ